MLPDLWLNEGGQSATGRLVSQSHISLIWKEIPEWTGQNTYRFLSILKATLKAMVLETIHTERIFVLKNARCSAVEWKNALCVNWPLPQHLLYYISNQEKQIYVNKMQVLGSCDPHTAPAALF